MSHDGVQPTDSPLAYRRSSNSRAISSWIRARSRKGSHLVIIAIFVPPLNAANVRRSGRLSNDGSNIDEVGLSARSPGATTLDRGARTVLRGASPMVIGSIARRYAKALFCLAVDSGRVEPWAKCLEALREAVLA